MAKDDRRKTVGSVFTSGFRTFHTANDEGRRRTFGVSQGKSNNAQRPLSKIGEGKDFREIAPRTNHYDMYRDQIEAYTDNLTKELELGLKKTDEGLFKGLDKLAENFEKQCVIIQAAGRPLERGISDEEVTIQKPGQTQETITIGSQMAHFKKLKEEIYAQLVVLWKEYEDIQTELMQFAISVLGEEHVEIANQQLSGEAGGQQKEDRTQPRSSSLNIREARDQHLEFEKGYENAFTSLVGMQDELNSLKAITLKENKAMLQSFRSHREKKVNELKGFLDSMGMI